MRQVQRQDLCQTVVGNLYKISLCYDAPQRLMENPQIICSCLKSPAAVKFETLWYQEPLANDALVAWCKSDLEYR